MRVPFVGPSYTARSLNVDAQRSVNCYLEMDPASPPNPVALYGTPGLLLQATLGTAPVRKALKQGGYLYVVAGSTVYRMTPSYSVTAIGTIGTGVGPVDMASNGTEILIVDGVGGWLATESSFAIVSDVDFPAGVTSCGYLDGFFLVSGDGSGRLYCNETPNDGAAWNGTDFASAEGSPDNTVRLIVDHREAWLIGTETAEVFVNTGNSDFPFERTGNAYIETGTCAPWSVAAMDNTLFWLGQDVNGAGSVFKVQGYTPVRISTHAMETAIAGYDLSDAQAYTYQFHGHSFYVLTFPNSDHTWVFDAATGQWMEWLWRDPAANKLHRHRSNCHVYFNGKHLVGDWETGALYSLEEDVYTDNGNPILRKRATQTMSADGSMLFYESLEVQMETGVGLATGQGSVPTLMLRYSNDGGHTWSNLKTRPIGLAGQYGARVKFGPTGAGRNRVWEISMTDPVKFAVMGASANVSKGF